MDEMQEQFDDPAFRQAIRQAVSKPTAPPRLREKVTALMSASPALAPAPQERLARSRWSLPARPSPRALAAAVLAFVAIGFAFMQISREFELFAGAGAGGPAKFNESFALAMVRTHHDCAKLPDHHLISTHDFATLDAELAKLEGVNVFAASLGDDWQFKGAGHCKLGDANAAHLLFTRGSESVSVFSMPKIEVGCGHSIYEHVIDGDIILGFTKDNALYALVESRSDGKPAKAKHARRLLAVVKNDIAATPASATQSADAANR